MDTFKHSTLPCMLSYTQVFTDACLQVLDQDEAKISLVMNNGYFFGLLDRMISGRSGAVPGSA